MMLLKNVHDVSTFMKAVNRCRGDVLLRSQDGREELNLKSQLSKYVAIERLHRECGDAYEIFCMDRADEGYMLKFFYDLSHPQE